MPLTSPRMLLMLRPRREYTFDSFFFSGRALGTIENFGVARWCGQGWRDVVGRLISSKNHNGLTSFTPSSSSMNDPLIQAQHPL